MNVFTSVPIPKVGKSKFNIGYEHMFTAKMGYLYPAFVKNVVPGDTVKLGNDVIVRFQPLKTPILQDVNAYMHYFFVPYRILWENWEEFITGGEDGRSTMTQSSINWLTSNGRVKGSIWDKIGLPVKKSDGSVLGDSSTDLCVPAWPRLAYNSIFNYYYKDENLQQDVSSTNEQLLKRAWRKDYFTSALTFTQRGDAPAVPISIGPSATIPVTFKGGSNYTGAAGIGVYDACGQITNNAGPSISYSTGYHHPTINAQIDASGLSTGGAAFSIADLRLTNAIQRWMEANALTGVRYSEFLLAHFGTSPNDDRLQKPAYIGGSKSHVVINEVTQTSSTDTTSPQGNLSGKGLTADSNYICKYKVREYGLLMGLFSCIPSTNYYGGIPREFIKDTKYDYFFPEFAHIGEQEIFQSEVDFETALSDPKEQFGFTGRFNEMRTGTNCMDYDMATKYAYWHLGRIFANKPLLNESFIQCSPRQDVFAMAEGDEPLIVDIGNKCIAYRPLPVYPTPRM